ncbi:polysaccharide pyruvyl transferase family protein [Leptolyngbya sp. 7M]|uniref:polysaccharide pyruvyl transferase family protein n=1 Tax=Leptolyngbya sp. 7M TaxID=2812896 RepID=UPI001B8C3F17|nr:polysaccharide pyruvyl transferase family protein [Leptolyngbya sp. 7M]QYO68123.1 hypothetical protein JVX88_15925 [Leptolyngbya sp. 7M]
MIDRIIQIGSIAKAHKLHFTVRLSLLDLEHNFSELNRKNSVNLVKLQPLIRILNFIQSCEFITDSKLECTINQATVYQLHEWLEFAINHNIPIVYKLGVPHQVAEANLPVEPDTFAFEQIYHLVIFLENLIRYYETSATQLQFYQSLIGQLIDHKPRSVGCKWQSGGVTLSATGELRYCAIASKSLGSTLKQDSVSLYETHQEHWYQILQTACHSCRQDCILPGATKTVSKVSKISFRTLFKQVSLLSQMKSSKLLKPLKTLRLQVGFQKHLQTLGVYSSISSPPKVAMHFPDARSSKRKVLICGWYGTETLGDKAILGGVLQALQEAIGEVEFHLVAIEVYISQMTIRQMPELQGCVLHSLSEGLEIVQSMDLVVFGGGPLMAIGAMAEIMAFFQRAVVANIPTMLTGCGVGPLGANFLNQAIRHVLLHSSYRIYRDQKSLENARALGVEILFGGNHTLYKNTKLKSYSFKR